MFTQTDLIIENEHQSLEIESFIKEVELAHGEKAVLISQLEKGNLELAKLNIDATQERKGAEIIRTEAAVLKARLDGAKELAVAAMKDWMRLKLKLLRLGCWLKVLVKRAGLSPQQLILVLSPESE